MLNWLLLVFPILKNWYELSGMSKGTERVFDHPLQEKTPDYIVFNLRRGLLVSPTLR